jgi:Mg-chelatase subunit ChlI
VDVGGLSPICRPLLVSMKTQSLRLVLEHRKEPMTIWRWCSSKFFHQLDVEAIRAMVRPARITRDIEELCAKIRAGADHGVEQQRCEDRVRRRCRRARRPPPRPLQPTRARRATGARGAGAEERRAAASHARGAALVAEKGPMSSARRATELAAAIAAES